MAAGIIAFALAGCVEKPYRVADEVAGSMHVAVRWNANPISEATEQLIFGDFPPYGSIDYVVRVTRASSAILWEQGQIILPNQPRFNEYCALLKESRK